MTNKQFSFNISLSVLNHLGRNLYRGFVTVLGEAISNSWDADAKNVWIYIDKERNDFIIKDDGDGMSENDFQNKFLKIGYSKRKDGNRFSKNNRPFIGRKGIGKLALLSCADRITVISKVKGGGYVGGTIDNADLDQAIVDDLSDDEYILGEWSCERFSAFIEEHEHGTIIHFDHIKSGIRNTLSYLKKIVALYFRFSLIDKSFNIYIDDEKVTHEHVGPVSEQTEFLWTINDYCDPYLKDGLKNLKETDAYSLNLDIKGFIASVEKPSDLKIRETGEKLTVDLFVNGRLRERNLLSNITTTRIVESYLYGQIHFDRLDEGEDPFTSNREGVISDNESYQVMLSELKDRVLSVLVDQWDDWRRKHKEEGDAGSKRITKKQRKSEELYNLISDEYSLPDDSPNKKIVDGWVASLGEDAAFNFASYAECFVSENLIRNFISINKISLCPDAMKVVDKYRNQERNSKSKGNISIDIRETNSDLSYLSISDLAALVDKKDPVKDNCLLRDAFEYKPIRDALMHTALLSKLAKNRLTMVYENVKGRLCQLLSEQINHKS